MNGTTALRRSVGGGGAGSQEPPPVATLVVYKDDAGYGMKVSGDNPVYVQSVKEGGAAARAGLHAGDKIIKVNGVNVMQSTHTEVVGLIKSSTQVVLTVQQKPAGSATGLQVGSPTGQQHQRPASLSAGSTMVSPTQPASSLHRASTAPAGGAPPSCNARITGPQPVDHEKKRQMDAQRVHTFQLMLEKEQSYVDKLRSDLAKSGAGAGSTSGMTALHGELAGAERRVRTLQDQLAAITTSDQLCSLVTNTSTLPGNYSGCPGGNVDGGGGDVPPPLPSRKSLSMQNLSPPPLPPRPPPTSNTNNILQLELDRHLLTHLTPPTTSYGIPNSLSQGVNFGSSGSLNKHQRTKSSPEQLSTTMISPSEASRRLIASESLNDLSPPRHSGIDLDDPVHVTPPGTPPPPYPQPSPASETSSSAINDSLGDSFVTISPVRQPLNESITGLPPIQKPIMSMEDDDMSDQEVGQLGDHGPFKSLSRLWEHHAHLSVFINYVLSNSDPSSLLFYLVTDLYKEGNTKEMRKWAYEIHSSFLVPDAPLRLNNVDENVAREIDDVLLKEFDKEEILRKIFWKARARAKEELNEQLADFQQKRTAGLGTLFGPKEEQLDECVNDKMHEARIMETYILPKMQPYLDALEADQVDLRKFTTAAGLATILTKIFQVRPMSLEQVPTFVAKDKSNIKARLTGKTRKMNVQGHHFVATQYFNVTFCNQCHLIIGGIGPQGYQCGDCSFSVHRACVRLVDETCPGPVIRKERANDRISRIMGSIRPQRKPPSSHHHHHMQNHVHAHDRPKRGEEDAGVIVDSENGGTNAPETRNRDKVAKIKRRQASTKPKSLNTKTLHASAKGSIVTKVWETLAAVRRSRDSCNAICKPTELLVHLDDMSPLSACSTEWNYTEIAGVPCRIESLAKLVASDVDLCIEEKDIFTSELLTTGEHRGGGASGNPRCEKGRIPAYGDYPDSMDINRSSREDISEMVQQNMSSKPKTSNINRSESYKERLHHKRQLREKRKTSDPNLSKTKAGFSDCEAAGSFPGNSAGSSSNSSLSTRSLDSPSTSLEQVHPANAGANTSTSWDSDVDVEADPPEWSQGVSEEVLSRLSNSEKKRQEVINELFHTERSHVRALKVLSYVFHRPLLDSQVLPLDQVQLLFSNLDEMVMIHSRFNQAMKRKKKENPCVGDVGDLLLEMFDGEAGEAFERSASTYCAKQQVALDALRDRRRKDPKLNSFLNEVEANPLCRRLQLKDHILTGMLRLTKYPLLFENLAKYTPESNEKEKAAVLRSLERSKEILSIVNQAVREADDYQRLAEIQRTIDRSAFDKFDHPTVQEFKNIDITKRKLVFEGPLQWRIVNRPKPVDLHVVLLDDTIFLLHRQDDKYLLKFINTNQVNSVLSPIVRVSTVLVRNNAVDKNSLYLVNTSQNGAQIYDLVAASQAERELWFKHISEAADAYYKARDREGRRPTPPTVMTEESANIATAVEPLPEQPATFISENDIHKSDLSPPETQTEAKHLAVDPTINPKPQDEKKDDQEPDVPDTTKNNQDSTQLQPRHSPTPGPVESMRMVTCTQCSLIDPIEVHTEVQPVHIAEPVLTPIECLRRKDEVIKRALVEKQSLVAEILNIPKEDFEHVADMASEPSGLEKEPAELILAAISQANQLVGLVNCALAVTETESVFASKGVVAAPTTAGCEATGCPIPRNHSHPYQPVIPVAALQPVCNLLTSQLSQLLEIVKEREEERERLRKELRRSRERLHALDADAHRREQSNLSTMAIHTQTESVTEQIPPTDMSSDKINKNLFADACGDPEQQIEETHDLRSGIESKVMGDSVG